MNEGKVHELCKDARFNRGILDRISAINLTEMNGRMALQFTLSTGDLQPDWLRRNEIVFRFVIDGGTRILEGRGWHTFRPEPESPHAVEVDLLNPSTGAKEKNLGEWTTLEIVVMAGGTEKHFEVRRTS